MRLGLSSYTYTWAVGVPGSEPARPLTALDLLERARELGVRVVQFADNLPLGRLSDGELDALARRAAEGRIAVEVGTNGIQPDHLARYLALCARFGSPILRVVIDTPECKPSVQEALAMLRPQQEAFEAAGVILAIENHDRFTSAELAGMVRALGPWCGICLDTVNSFGALEGPRVVLEQLGPLTVNLHVKDFTIYRAGHKMGFTIEGRPAGQGRLDVPWLLDELRRQERWNGGQPRSAILELWTPPEPDIEATVAKERRWAEESVAYLRALIPG